MSLMLIFIQRLLFVSNHARRVNGPVSMFSETGFDFFINETNKSTNFSKFGSFVINSFLSMADFFSTAIPKSISLGSRNASVIVKVKQNVKVRRRFMMSILNLDV